MSVLVVERQMVLVDSLRQNPVLAVEDLARRFRVSAQTVRRDLQYLEREGLIRRTRGGAVAHDQDALSPEHAFTARELEDAAQKRAIAATALALVEPGSTVIMDASTTVLYLARALPRDIELNVVVNALPVNMELCARARVGVTMLGGTMRPTSLSATGPTAEATLRCYFADTAFISARGLSLERGLTEASASESALKEIMVANAARVIALVDARKLGRTAFTFVAPLSAIDVLITDDSVDPRMVERLRETGLDVRVARTSP